MSFTKITRFENNGPSNDGLELWNDIGADDIETPVPVEHGHLYFNDEETGLMAGVWNCTPFTTKLKPFGVNEFMQLLKGSVTIELADGSEITIKAGECFVIPKGLVCKWKQTEDVRKYFMIFDDKSDAAIPNPENLNVIVLNDKVAVSPINITDTSQFMGDAPKQNEHDFYADVTGQFLVGMWQSEAFERPVAPINRTELMCILDGEVTLSGGEGDDQVFKAGDAAFVSKGAPYKWKSAEFVNKYYCIFLPKE